MHLLKVFVITDKSILQFFLITQGLRFKDITVLCFCILINGPFALGGLKDLTFKIPFTTILFNSL